MSFYQNRVRNQVKEARLEIVSQLYKRGYSLGKIRCEVMARLDLKTYSKGTVHNDIKTLLREWRESRLEDMDEALQLELTRIDDTVRELWEQWEKSKEDYTQTYRRRKGAPERRPEGQQAQQQQGQDGQRTRTLFVEESTRNVQGLGNPAYISEIRQQLAERRKLLGLYAPEKKQVEGEMSFANFLMESGMLDEAEQQNGE
jgi:hypothetical protein